MKNSKYKSKINTLLLITLIGTLSNISFAQKNHVQLGNFKLENGSTIENCVLGYATFGKLNDTKSNVILFPTYYGGTAESIKMYVGEDASMLDSTKYHIIIMEAFGNGVSSSPSNSKTQPRGKFPEFSIRDMVNAQYMALTQKLGIEHVYAITGISMGGMQTFQWMASYPDYFDKAAPIVGSPQLTSYDLLAFKIFNQIMEGEDETEAEENRKVSTALMLEYLLGLSPTYRINNTGAKDFEAFADTIKTQAEEYDLYNLHSQMKAISNYDITDKGNLPLQKVSELFKGDLLVIVAEKDQMLLPYPAMEFAKTDEAELLILDSECGHYSFACEIELISSRVSQFLN